MTSREEKVEFTPADLLVQIRSGDRDALAEAIRRYRPLIEQMIRLKLRGSLRKLFDTGDVLGTVTRKLDRALQNGELVLNDGDHLGALLVRMIRQSVVDKHRLISRLQHVEGPDSAWAEAFIGKTGLKPTDAGVEETLEHAMAGLPDERDKRILSMWLHGLSHGEIAERLDLSPANARQRWHRIRGQLREQFV